MSHEIEIVSKSPKEFAYAKKKSAEAMRNQVTAFAIMIFFTFIAFALVMAGFSPTLVVPVILLLAVVQVILQLYFFMHWSEKGHGIPQFFMYSGALVAFTMVLAFVTIIWWE
ncbi:cytochrome c oxidase subunit IVB [Kurthia sibirica]|uniref:Cytochrome c oxidase subunit IVB n=1 Tax=Kurthia sibirica TaxID=202750 RepID=A0A2U3AQR9_9BACL|nr:cytochrome c oxidase subunit IVB [Kurthia sibirica]PWI26795.1 cytochrome c oxidase subunit IVB [Kurthia sibirica]GEK32670.1 cytochrome c oxidase subunit IVB [Kurthia sibirica]